MARNSYKARPRRGLGGFTLVELVVVIAVLAILAGVGAVAYNGYIEYAKKGVDRKTIGEIEHALEVADYADPGLINGRIQIFFTGNKGIVIPTDVSGKVTDALEDAFGEGALPNTKPSYEKWGSVQSSNYSLEGLKFTGAPDLELLIDNYVQAISNGGAASFAGEIDTLWVAVGNLVGLSETGFGNVFGPDDKGNLFKKAIEYSTTSDKEDLLKKWTTDPTADEQGAVFNLDSRNAATVVARNYSFASYALRHPSTTKEMKETLYAYMDTSKGIGDSIAQQYPTDAIFAGEAWESIKKDYVTSGQAKIDAEAFISLMNVANTVELDKQGDETDDRAYLRTLGDYTDELAILLSDPSLLETLQSSTGGEFTTVNSENGISFAAQKINGVLVFTDFSNPDADPTGGSPSKPTVVEEEECTETHNTEITIEYDNGKPKILEDGVSEINLCSKNSKYKTCTVSLKRNGSTMTSNNITVEVTNETGKALVAKTNVANGGDGTFTLEAVSAGNATLTVKWGSSTSFTCNINIH